MATVDRLIAAPPADVFAVLADGWLYSGWVVGTSHMRAVEAGWPAAGSRLFHASGLWPAVIPDETVVEECAEDERLVLTAEGGPLGAARIGLRLAAEGGGTRVHMSEEPSKGLGRLVHNPLFDAAIARRNDEALQRLAYLSEKPEAPPGVEP
jgi:uncharacterized protein YndB with AHSA1/START domain